MSERKEILEKIAQKNALDAEKKALEKALKDIKRENSKKALKTIFSLIKKGLVTVWACIVKLKDGVAYIFNIVNSFRQALNLQAEIKIRDAQTEEETRRLRKSHSRKAIVLALLAFFIGSKISDKDISIKNMNSVVKSKSIESFANDTKDDAQSNNDNAKGKTTNNSTKSKAINNDNSNPINTNNGSEVELIGKVSSKFELGTEDLGAVVESKDGTFIYGQFSSDSSKEDYVINFLKYMTSVNKDMYTNNFSGSDAPGTDSFKTHWENTVKKEGNNFNKMQVEYKWNNLVKPTVDKINTELNVNLSETLLLQELIYSTVSQYGSEKAFELIKNSNLHINMTEIEILNAVQDTKESSLGVYTYTNEDGCDNKLREIIKNRINSERIELSRLVGKPAQAM